MVHIGVSCVSVSVFKGPHSEKVNSREVNFMQAAQACAMATVCPNHEMGNTEIVLPTEHHTVEFR